jgi:uncharacterized protein (DUF488 family)
MKRTIFTIGHSTHSTREFMRILNPGSRYCPQFGKSRLKQSCKRNEIEYAHLVDLGGRRRVDKDSHLNEGWRSAQFRGYADYMQTGEFKKALRELIKIAKDKEVAIMCSEAVPWRCHRSMIADALLIYNFQVVDIFTEKNARPHALTSFARVEGKRITYPQNV